MEPDKNQESEQQEIQEAPIVVEIIRHPQESDWMRCKMLALNTVMGKQGVMTAPNRYWMEKILKAEHSPIRTLMFTVRMEIPSYVSVHFTRHSNGAEHYVTSQRNDRQSFYDRRKAPQDAMVTHIMECNAQSLMNMARRRMCGKADEVTRRVMVEIVNKVIRMNPEFDKVLWPMCVYQGRCPEFTSCGYYAGFEDETRKPSLLRDAGRQAT